MKTDLAGASGDHLLRNGLNKDRLSQLFAQGQAGVADQTDNIGVARQQFDNPVFAKANFTQSIAECRRGAQLFDADRHPCLHSVKRTKRVAAESIFFGAAGFLYTLHTLKKLKSMQNRHYTDFVIRMSFFGVHGSCET
jgi:hypothetical protein